MKWHDVVVHKNVFRDCVTYMAMQRCDIAQWHDGLKRPGRQGCHSEQLPYRTTSHGEQHIPTPCFPVGCWSPMDCTWVSSGSLIMSQNCASNSARHSRLPQTFRELDTPRYNNGTAKKSHRLCWSGTKGKVTTFLDESSLWSKPGVAHTNQTWNANQINANFPVLIQRMRPTQCAVKVMFIVAYDINGPRCTSKANGKRCLLLHVPAGSPSSSAQGKTTTLGGTEPHYSSWQCKEPHRCCCHGPLAPLTVWFCYIYRAQPIWAHAISISSSKWKNHCEGPGATQDMNLHML